MDYIRQILPYFEKKIQLTDCERAYIMSRLTVKKVKKSEYLHREGDITDSYNFVIQGGLRMYHITDEFKEYTLHFGFENTFIGDLNSFAKSKPSSFNIQAIENTIALQISRADHKSLFEKIPKLYDFFITLYEDSLI